MILKNPIILNINNESITISTLDIVIIDDSNRKIVLCRLSPFLRPILLWKDNDYDAIGDYTQAQVEEKVLSMMGDDQAKFLQSL